MPKIRLDDYDEFDDELYQGSQKIVRTKPQRGKTDSDKRNKPQRGKKEEDIVD